MNNIEIVQAYPINHIDALPSSSQERPIQEDENGKLPLYLSIPFYIICFVCISPFVILNLYYSNDSSCAMQYVGRHGQLRLSYIMILDASVGIFELVHLFYFVFFSCTMKQYNQLMNDKQENDSLLITQKMEIIHFFILILYIFQFWSQMDIQQCSDGIYYYVNTGIFVGLFTVYRILSKKRKN